MAALRALVCVVVAFVAGAVLVQRPGSDAGASPNDPDVSQLDDSLAKMRQKAQAHLSELKAGYDANLSSQEEGNVNMESQNERLAADIKDVEQLISDKRGEAAKLQTSNEDFRSKITGGLENLGFATEFATKVLNRSKLSVKSTPELMVIGELNEEDAHQEESAQHERQLGEVGRGRALLQISQRAVSKGGGSPEEARHVLEALAASVDAFQADQAAAEVSLQKWFDKAFAEGQERSSHLKKKHEQLEDTRASTQATADRLINAVDTLAKSNAGLSSAHESLFGFLQQLGNADLEAMGHKTAVTPTLEFLSPTDPTVVAHKAIALWGKMTR